MLKTAFVEAGGHCPKSPPPTHTHSPLRHGCDWIYFSIKVDSAALGRHMFLVVCPIYVCISVISVNFAMLTQQQADKLSDSLVHYSDK